MIGTTFANRYHVVDQLSADGTNPVWRARDLNQDQDVALKTFKPGSPTIHVYGEAAVLTALEGEHVLRVYNADTFDDIPYIATRIAAFGSTEGIHRGNPRGIRADYVVSWIRQALVGLGACHDRGLLHRDVKPANIFLDSLDLALLGDFGLAHRLDEDGTAPYEGSPLTMAPEMWSEEKGTVRSDIYSMGVTAYRLLTGAWPFEADGRDAMRVLVPQGRFMKVRDRSPHISRRLADRIEKAMALLPAERYSSWREMHEDLGRPGVAGHAWQLPRPHPGHSRCWREAQPTGSARVVCLVPSGSDTSDIEVRYDGGRRISKHCREGVVTRRHPVELREIFDHL